MRESKMSAFQHSEGLYFKYICKKFMCFLMLVWHRPGDPSLPVSGMVRCNTHCMIVNRESSATPCLFVYVYAGCFPCLASKAMPSGFAQDEWGLSPPFAHAGEFLSRMASALWHSLFMVAFFPKVSHRNRNRRGIRRFLSHRHQSPFINPNMAKRPVFHSRKRAILFSEWRRKK